MHGWTCLFVLMNGNNKKTLINNKNLEILK
jgi:hypothetical protein